MNEIQPLLHINDYNTIKTLLAEYHKTESQITREKKMYNSKTKLYSKTCHCIFEYLTTPLLAISKVVAILNRIDKVTLESKTSTKDAILSATILRIKTSVAKEYTEQKIRIVQECSEVQISIRIKSMSMILQVNPDMSGDESEHCPLIETFCLLTFYTKNITRY